MSEPEVKGQLSENENLATSSAKLSENNQPVVVKQSKGGFMNGGMPTTLLFLIAFFLVSYGLGVVTERNNKLITNTSANVVNGSAIQQQQAQQAGLRDGDKVEKKFNEEAARTQGDKNAKVTMYIFSDFQCPFCEKFYTESYKEIVNKYVKAGKLKIVFKDLPLSSLHPQAQKAAEAARCAQEQNKFWEMHDKLFENQSAFSVENFKKWAGDLKLDTNKFNQCLDSSKYSNAVKKDLDEGSEIGVEGTPTFVVGGTALVGAQPLSSFEKILDEKLK